MTGKHKIWASLWLCLLLAGCGSMPKHAETRADQPPTISISGLPGDAWVMVDGTHYIVPDGGVVRITVSAGAHSVIINSNGVTIYEREIFIEKGTTREIDAGS